MERSPPLVEYRWFYGTQSHWISCLKRNIHCNIHVYRVLSGCLTRFYYSYGLMMFSKKRFVSYLVVALWTTKLLLLQIVWILLNYIYYSTYASNKGIMKIYYHSRCTVCFWVFVWQIFKKWYFVIALVKSASSVATYILANFEQYITFALNRGLGNIYFKKRKPRKLYSDILSLQYV